MNNLKHYDLNNYNFYENNKLFKLEFNLEDVIIYELISGGYITNEILNEFIEKNKNINENIKKLIKDYIDNPYQLGKEQAIPISKYIKLNNKYVNDLSLWVDFNKLNNQAIDDTSRDIKIYKNKRFLNIKEITSFYKSNITKIIKLYLFFTQNFIGFMIINLIEKLGFNFLNINLIPKSSRIITINENIISLNLQEYELELILNDKHKKILLFYYNFKINLLENKFILEYKCKWENTFNIKFFKCVELYSEKVNKIETKRKNYSQNLTLLLNNNLNNESRDKLFYIIKNTIIKLDNKEDLDYLNKILKYIDNYVNLNYDLDSIIFSLLSNEDINNFFKNKNLINKIYQKIPIKRDETKKSYDKDFFIVNFNEEKKLFNNNDCHNIFVKILIEQPSFIIVSTQDCNLGGKGHYQHLLGERLKINGYTILVKNTIDTMRMRIYYNNNKVKFNKSEQKYKYRIMQGGDLIPSRIKQIFKKSNNLQVKEDFSNSSNNLKNFNKDIFLIKKYGRKESKEKKYGDGLVFMRLEISKNNINSKFIFINCNLSSNKEDEFEKIVNDFKLVYYWSNGYNIFFCGTFNFIFKPYLYENTEIVQPIYYYNELNNEKKDLKEKKGQIAYNAGPKKFIREYSTNISINKKKSSEKFIKSDTFAIFLDKIIKNGTFSNKNTFKTTFYLNLLDSIEKLGIHPTYKYIKDESNKQEDFYNNIIYYTNKLKNINKQNRYIIKFLNIPNLLEKIKNDKNLVYEYFNIFVRLNLFDEVRSIIENTKSKKINEESKKIKEEKIINYLMNMKEKNFINKKTVNELLIQKYNKNGNIKSIINFLEGINEQNKNKIKKYIDNLQKFINDKESFNKVKIIIEKYIENKDIFKLNKDCEKFIKNVIDKGLITEDENNNIVIEKKRDNLLEKYNEIFNTEGNKIIPYQNNRILYALINDVSSNYNTIIRNSFDFNVYLFPDKSSHKLTTLSFKIDNKDNKNIYKKNSSLRIEEKDNNNILINNNIYKNKHTAPPYLNNRSIIPKNKVSSMIEKIEKK